MIAKLCWQPTAATKVSFQWLKCFRLLLAYRCRRHIVISVMQLKCQDIKKSRIVSSNEAKRMKQQKSTSLILQKTSEVLESAHDPSSLSQQHVVGLNELTIQIVWTRAHSVSLFSLHPIECKQKCPDEHTTTQRRHSQCDVKISSQEKM